MRGMGVWVGVPLWALCSFSSAFGEPLEPRLSLEWLHGVSVTDPQTGPLNPGNRLMRVPQIAASSILRPQIRLTAPALIDFVARPSFSLAVEKSHVEGSWEGETFSVKQRWNELFATATFSESLALTYGLQNFQWGDAELSNPSNMIFSESGLTRTGLSEIRGREVLRANLSKGRAWSLVLLMETRPSEQELFRVGERFERKTELKGEWAAEDGSSYFGVAAVGHEARRLAFGEYGSWSLSDSLALYFDAGHRRGGEAWYPVESPRGAPLFAQRRLGTDGWLTTALVGGRLSLDEGREIRLEYLENESGYSSTEMHLGVDAVTRCSPRLCAKARAAFAAPGLEFFGRRYLFLSGRVPEFGSENKFTSYLRYLYNVDDSSGRLFSQVEYALSDASLLYAAGILNHGDEGSEFVRTVRSSALLGVKNVW